MNENDWIMGRDTGISSKTIWAVMMGATTEGGIFGFDVPHDPSDFGRCYRLLRYLPEWRGRLNEVASRFPKWVPMVREWNKMTAIYERDLESGKSSELYELMEKLENEGRSIQNEQQTKGP